MGLLAIGLVASGIGLPLVAGAGLAIIGLGAVGGLLGAGALAKLCSNLKSPWWAKTVDGQRQWAERRAAVDVGNGIEEMVKNQVLKGAVDDDAEFNTDDQSQWKDPALLKPDMVVGWMKLAKHNSPDEMKAKIREELLNPNKSFLHEQTIKDAKRGALTGWWFTGNPKGHAEKTVNIVAEEIYRGVMRGMASGYMSLVEAEMADAKTKDAQDALKPWLADNIEGFKSALSRFPAGVDANQPADGALESRAFEFYETDKALAKVGSYQSQAEAVQTQLTEKKDIIGEANHGVYSEVLKSFNHDVATFKDSLGVVDRLVHGKDAPDGNPSIQSVNTGLGKILDTHLNPSEEMGSVVEIQQRLHADLEALDGLIAKEVAEENADPALLKQHHDGLTELAAKYKGENGAIQAVAKFATTLATAEKALKGNDLTRDKIQEQKESLDGLNKLSQGDACPLKTDTAVLGKISRVEGNRDKMVEDIDNLDKAYAQFENMKASSAGLVEKAKSNLGEVLKSDEFKNLGHQKDSVLLGLKKWEETNHAIPVDLNPETEFASIKRQMVARALGLREGSELGSMAFALEALCEENRTSVVDSLKDLGVEKTADLLTTLNTIHDGEGSATVKAAKTYEVAVQSGIDSNEAATLAKTLYPGQVADLESFRKFSVVLSNLNTVQKELAGPLASWAKLEGIVVANTSTRSGFLELLGNEKLGVLTEDKKALLALKTQVDRLGEGSLADHADQIAEIDSDTLRRLEQLSSTLSGSQISTQITQATTHLEAQVAALNQRIGGDVGLSKAATAENVSELEAAGGLIKLVVENQNDAEIQLKNATLSAEEAAKAIHTLVRASISVEEMTKKLVSTPELKQLLQLGIAAEQLLNGSQDIPSLSHHFTPDQVKKGLQDLRKFEIVPVKNLKHLNKTERVHLAKRNIVIERIKKDTKGIDGMESSKADQVIAEAINNHRTEIENFLHEERAYEAMKSLYQDGTVSTADLRRLFEKSTADYLQLRIGLNRNLGTHELLGYTNLDKLDDKHLENLTPRINVLNNLKDGSNPNSIWRESAYLQGVASRLNEIRGEGKTKAAFEQAASGGLVEYGKRLHQGDAGKDVNQDELRLNYLKGQSDAVKRGLKYLNPKTMENVRPGIFRRLYNKIFSPATKYEKLVGSADLKSLSENISKLSQNSVLQEYLNGTLGDLKDQQDYLVQKRNALVGDAKKVELGLRMFAIEHLAGLAATNPSAKLTVGDFDAAVATWKERLGESQNAFSDFEKDLKVRLVGKSISELEADLDPETLVEFDKQLESLEAHERDVARAHEQLAAKINAAVELVTYKEMTKSDFGSSRLFRKDQNDSKPPTWMEQINIKEFEANTTIRSIFHKMRDASYKSSSKSQNELESHLTVLSQVFSQVDDIRPIMIGGIRDESVDFEKLQIVIDGVNNRLPALKALTNDAIQKIKNLPEENSLRSYASESIRDRLVNGYPKETSALDLIQARINDEFSKIDRLQKKLQDMVEKALSDVKGHVAESEIADEERVSLQDSKIQYIANALGNPEGLAEILTRLDSEDLADFELQAVNALTSEGKAALLASIQAKAGNPLPQDAQVQAQQPAANSEPTAVNSPAVQAQVQATSRSFDKVKFDSFASGDTPRPKLNNTDWSNATNKPDNLKDYVHIPSAADGYCLLTSLAASRNQTTKELIAQLDQLAMSLDTEGKNQWESAKIDAVTGKGIEQSAIVALLVRAGLNFQVVQLKADGAFDSMLPLVGDPQPSQDSPVLLFREKHFDLLLPKSVADQNSLHYDGSQFITNDMR